MKIQFDNQSLLNIITEQCTLKALANAGSNVALTVDDNSGFANDDFVIAGTLMRSRAEIAKINTSVTLGTSFQVDSLTFAHNPMEVISKVAYDKVRLYNSTTVDGTKTLIDTLDIDVEKRYTDFEVSNSIAGYVFFTLYNSVTAVESGYSYQIAIDTIQKNSLQYVRDFVEVFYTQDIDDTKLRMLVDTVIDNIYQLRTWRFREGTATFNTVAGQTDYNIVDDCGITDFDKLLSATTDNEHLTIADTNIDDTLRLNPVSLAPMTIYIWGDEFRIYVDGVKPINIKYYKNAQSVLTSGTEIAVSLISAVGYGVLRLLYMPIDTDMSDRFEAEQDKVIKIMTRADEKFASRITSLPESKRYNIDVTPNIIAG